jgi:hypothetical protein
VPYENRASASPIRHRPTRQVCSGWPMPPWRLSKLRRIGGEVRARIIMIEWQQLLPRPCEWAHASRAANLIARLRPKRSLDAARCVVHVGRATAKACMKFRMHMLSEFFFSRLLNAIYPLILTLCWERGFDADSFKAYSAAPTCSSRHWSCRFAAKTRHVPQALQRRPR